MSKLTWSLEEALKLRQEGLNYKQIAEMLNVKPITIQCYFVKHYGRVSSESRSAKRVELTQVQKEVMFGSLLGDCNLHIGKACKNASGKMEHCIAQLEYLQWKHQHLSNISTCVKTNSRYDSRTDKVYHACRIEFTSNPALTDMYNMFYKPTKVVPDNLSLLTPLALAVWFMDDGYKSVSGYYFSTDSFSKEDICRLGDYLKATYNLDYSVTKGNKLYIKASSKRLFEFLVLKYMVESMKYKIAVS